jgi:Uncharacterised nucleotidyltransferase
MSSAKMIDTRRTTSRGGLLAAILSKSWREAFPHDLSLSESQLDQVTDLLYRSGAAGLGWWRIRESDLRQTASGEVLHQAFRLATLQAAIQEAKIRRVFNILRSVDVEPILIKGWAVARAYPRPALRPAGAIDLILRPRDYRKVRDAAEAHLRDCRLDCHGLPFELADRSIEELFSRSQLVPCADDQIRVLAREDHFALLAIHLLKHGAWRPLWLCDLAVLLESPGDFDWDLCFGKDPRRANWILAATGLAQALLDASINDEGVAARARQVPAWLQRQVLKEWDAPFADMQSPFRHPEPISFQRPRGLLADLALRWPNPIVATISVKGSFGARRRTRYEFGNWAMRAARVVAARLNVGSSFG